MSKAAMEWQDYKDKFNLLTRATLHYPFTDWLFFMEKNACVCKVIKLI